MSQEQQNLKEELQYLQNVLDFLKTEIDTGTQLISERKSKLIASRRDMWENSVHFSTDFERMTEVNQHLSEVTSQTAGYASILRQLEKYRRILASPYFGRFDFAEDTFDDVERIYIGIHNVMDSDTHDIYVYDWRTPIASIFYQYELGKVAYISPMGQTSGEVLLKRQYRIEGSELKYFFDSSIRINDEMLQEVLYRNASPNMRNIVETIQKEQDLIIRDTDNDLLIVQGVAGSGKTSIALHRIAFLLYHGMSSGLGSNNIIILSPNDVFSSYISSVLPELGEENVRQVTFHDILCRHLGESFELESRSQQLEALISEGDSRAADTKRQAVEFKGSQAFASALDRLIRCYERQLIPVEDIYYDGKIIETKQQFKNFLLNNKIRMPLSKRLKRLESSIMERIHPLQRKRVHKYESIVANSEAHVLEIKSFSRLLSIKETKRLLERMHSFTEVDYFSLYKRLFSDSKLFTKVFAALSLPQNIDKIISATIDSLDKGSLSYEDCAPLLYLKLKLEGSDSFSEIKQVVIDEAQDYYPLQYEVFKLLFKGAKYTVLGDINQSIERNGDISLYDSVLHILDKRKAVKLFLTRSYRSSFEINRFNQKLLSSSQSFISFERYEEEPQLICKDYEEQLISAVAEDIKVLFAEGFGSIAVICKTQEEAENVHIKLSQLVKIQLVLSTDIEMEKGAVVLPSYMAKGLEFDGVLVFGASIKNYSNEFDRRLLYIACSRALHKLRLYYIGEKSPYIEI